MYDIHLYMYVYIYTAFFFCSASTWSQVLVVWGSVLHDGSCTYMYMYIVHVYKYPMVLMVSYTIDKLLQGINMHTCTCSMYYLRMKCKTLGALMSITLEPHLHVAMENSEELAQPQRRLEKCAVLH